MNGQKKLFWLVLLSCLLFASQAGQASAAKKKEAGSGLEGVKVHLYGKSGDEWFIAKTKRINRDGILEYKNVLPGWGKVVLAGNTKNAYAGKTFTSKMKLLDDEGRSIKKPTPVDIYAKIGGVKHFIATMKTDKNGWLIVPHSIPGIETYMEVKGEGKKLSKNNSERPVVKVRANMEEGDWMTIVRKRLDKDGVLTIKNAVPGKTEFEYVGDYKKIAMVDLIDKLNEAGKLSDHLADKFKQSDFAGKSFPKPFTLKVQVLDDKGRKLTKPTKVKMTVYLKNRTISGYMKTNSKGWLTVKGVPVNIKTKMEVKD